MKQHGLAGLYPVGSADKILRRHALQHHCRRGFVVDRIGDRNHAVGRDIAQLRIGTRRAGGISNAIANGDIGDLVADRLDRSRTLHANSGGHFERIKTAAMIAIDIVQSDRLMPDTDLSSARRRNIDFCPAHNFGAALFLNDDGMGHDCILS